MIKLSENNFTTVKNISQDTETYHIFLAGQWYEIGIKEYLMSKGVDFNLYLNLIPVISGNGEGVLAEIKLGNGEEYLTLFEIDVY